MSTNKDNRSLKDTFLLIIQILVILMPMLMIFEIEKCPLKDDGTFMKCHPSFLMLVFIYIFLSIATFLTLTFAKCNKPKAIMYMAAIFVSTACFVLFYDFPLCVKTDHPCHMMLLKARTFVPVHSVITFIMSFITIKDKRKGEQI